MSMNINIERDISLIYIDIHWLILVYQKRYVET